MRFRSDPRSHKCHRQHIVVGCAADAARLRPGVTTHRETSCYLREVHGSPHDPASQTHRNVSTPPAHGLWTDDTSASCVGHVGTDTLATENGGQRRHNDGALRLA